jgi:hypothetical protein
MQVKPPLDLQEKSDQPVETPARPAVSKPVAPRTALRPTKLVMFGVFFQKFGFVATSTMFVVMVFFTAIMTWVAWNEPHLSPNVVDDQLHQDTVYIKFDDENVYHELARTTESANLDPSEVTQIGNDRSFKIMVTAKRLTLPDDYRVSLIGQGPNDTNLPYADLDRQVTVPKGTDFQLLTIFPPSGSWKPGRYELNFPDAANMFGGQFFAYFTVYEPGKPPPA